MRFEDKKDEFKCTVVFRVDLKIASTMLGFSDCYAYQRGQSVFLRNRAYQSFPITIGRLGNLSLCTRRDSKLVKIG